MTATTIVSLIARKGGAGKTTSAANIAAGLARQGNYTLAADSDAQGHLAVAYGCEYGPEASDAFAAYIAGDSLGPLTRPIPPANLRLLAGGEATRLAESQLASQPAMLAAAERFRVDTLGYEYAVIDSGPRGPLQDWAVAVADIVVVCAPCNYLGASAVFDALRLIGVISAATGRRPAACVLPTMYEQHKKDSRFWLHQLRQEVRSARLLAPVPMRVKVAESLAAGIPLVGLAPDNDAARAYMAVVEQIERTGGYEQLDLSEGGDA